MSAKPVALTVRTTQSIVRRTETLTESLSWGTSCKPLAATMGRPDRLRPSGAKKPVTRPPWASELVALFRVQRRTHGRFNNGDGAIPHLRREKAIARAGNAHDVLEVTGGVGPQLDCRRRFRGSHTSIL